MRPDLITEFELVLVSLVTVPGIRPTLPIRVTRRATQANRGAAA